MSLVSFFGGGRFDEFGLGSGMSLEVSIPSDLVCRPIGCTRARACAVPHGPGHAQRVLPHAGGGTCGRSRRAMGSHKIWRARHEGAQRPLCARGHACACMNGGAPTARGARACAP